ncbi:MAG: hypothetical protein NG740_00610 [Omnitrophica bacterium]|nr:hypothetical protein [Candidatus Omnitrophota bacterium]
MEEGKKETKWYFKTSWLVILFLSIGPLALPLVWINPGFSRNRKVIISVIAIVITYFLSVMFAGAVKSIMSYYQELLKLI